jgi:hypothetical protein
MRRHFYRKLSSIVFGWRSTEFLEVLFVFEAELSFLVLAA